MARVAVITPCAPAHLAFLEDAYSSLALQDVAWEWAIQIDGIVDSLPAFDDPRVSVEANDRSWGAAIARNRALIRTTAPYVISFDADDVLRDQALSRLAGQLDDAPDCAFINATILNWHPDGSLELNRKQSPLPEGRVEPGAIERAWREHSWHGLNTGVTMFRRDYLLAVGGWSALSGAEDNDLLMACNAQWPGLISKTPAIQYRMHSEQTTRSTAFSEMRVAHRRFTHERLNALRRVRGVVVPQGYEAAPLPPETHASR